VQRVQYYIVPGNKIIFALLFHYKGTKAQIKCALLGIIVIKDIIVNSYDCDIYSIIFIFKKYFTKHKLLYNINNVGIR